MCNWEVRSVFTRPFAVGYSLHSSLDSHSSHPTLDGVNLFLDVNPGNYKVVLTGKSVALAAYFASLVLVLGIMIYAGNGRLSSFFESSGKTLHKKFSLFSAERGDP